MIFYQIWVFTWNRIKRLAREKASRKEFDSSLMRQRAANQDANKMKQTSTCTAMCKFPPSMEDTSVLWWVVDPLTLYPWNKKQVFIACLDFLSTSSCFFHGPKCQYLCSKSSNFRWHSAKLFTWQVRCNRCILKHTAHDV